MLKRRGGGVLTISALFAIWVASNAVEAFRIAFDRAYKVDDRRHFITGRLLAIGFVLLGAVVTALLGFSVILSPLLLHLAEQWSGERVPGGAGFLIYSFGLIVFTGFLFLMHRHLPGERLPLNRLWPGVVVSTVLWMFGAVFFSFYLRYAPSFTVTYGALTGVVITLLFFYLTGAVIIFGAEVNAAWNRAGLHKGWARGREGGTPMAVGLRKKRRIQLVVIGAALLALATGADRVCVARWDRVLPQPERARHEPASRGRAIPPGRVGRGGLADPRLGRGDPLHRHRRRRRDRR